MTQDLTLTSVEQALARYRTPAEALHHSDRGSQHAPMADPARQTTYAMTASTSRKGICGANARIKSWHSLLKNESVYLHHFRMRAEATQATCEYRKIFYNRLRLCGPLGYRTPPAVEAAISVV